jgi:hypothetical protein
MSHTHQQFLLSPHLFHCNLSSVEARVVPINFFPSVFVKLHDHGFPSFNCSMSWTSEGFGCKGTVIM